MKQSVIRLLSCIVSAYRIPRNAIYLQVLGAILCVAVLSNTAAAQIKKYSETSVKAAFVYNFFKFIEWPETHTGNVRLCVLASEELNEALRRVNGKALDRGVLHVRMLEGDSAVEELSACDAVFLGATDRKTRERILARAVERRLLSIGEEPAFFESGGVINFYAEDDKLRFEINLARVEDIGVKVSSKLLKLGRVVNNR